MFCRAGELGGGWMGGGQHKVLALCAASPELRSLVVFRDRKWRTPDRVEHALNAHRPPPHLAPNSTAAKAAVGDSDGATRFHSDPGQPGHPLAADSDKLKDPLALSHPSRRPSRSHRVPTPESSAGGSGPAHPVSLAADPVDTSLAGVGAGAGEAWRVAARLQMVMFGSHERHTAWLFLRGGLALAAPPT